MKKILFLLVGIISLLPVFGQVALKESFNGGVAAFKSKDYQVAIDSFTVVLGKATEVKLKKYCYIYRGLSYNGMYSYKAAVADFDKAIELDPNDISTYTDRGISKAYGKNVEGAKSDFWYVLSKDSMGEQGQAALYYLGKIAYQEGWYELSVSYYEKLIKLNPNDAEVYFNIGVAKGMLMDSEASIAFYDKAIKLNPQYAEAYANRGVAKINILTAGDNINPTKEQTADACADLQKAHQLGDNAVDDMIEVYCNSR